MKGIEAIIAVILLLLITISVVGFAFLFFSRITTSTSAASENQTTEQINKFAKQVGIESSSNTTVWVKNVGSATMNGVTELNLYINGAPRTCSPALGVMTPGNVSKCVWSGAACVSGDIIKITSPSNSVQVNC